MHHACCHCHASNACGLAQSGSICASFASPVPGPAAYCRWSGMDRTLIMLVLASFLVSAVLLWLAAETVAASAGRPSALSRALVAGSVVLAGCGLWWPAHALRVHEVISVAGVASRALPWAPALLMALLAGVAGVHMRRREWPLVALAAVALPVAVYGHAVFSAPGVF